LKGKYHLLELLEEAELHLQIGQIQMSNRLLQIVWCDHGLNSPELSNLLLQISQLYQQKKIVEAIALHQHVDELMKHQQIRLYDFWYQSFDQDFRSLIQRDEHYASSGTTSTLMLRSRLNPAARPFVPSRQMFTQAASLR
jgi:hypothetical protein